MIFNKYFNDLIFLICNYNDDFNKHFCKMQDNIPKKYLNQLKKLQPFQSNEDIHYISLNKLVFNLKNQLDFVFAYSNYSYKLILNDYKIKKPNDCLNKIAKRFGSNLKIDDGLYMGSFFIADNINEKQIQIYFHIREEQTTQYLDIVEVKIKNGKFQLAEISLNKILNFQRKV